MHSPRSLALLGGGALAREIADVVRAVNADTPTWELVGFFDDAPDPAVREANAEALGVPLLGTLSDAKSQPTLDLVMAIATPKNPSVRADIDARLDLDPSRFVALVHPACAIASSTRVGTGSVLLAGVVTTADVSIGKHVIAMPGVVFTHDDRIGDYATFGAGALIAGRVTIGKAAYIGSGACIREGITIGAGALVGAGSVVTRDVPPGEVWFGVPAQPRSTGSRSTGPADVFVHPRGLCESSDVGAGTRVWAYAHVLDGAVIGERCNICDHAYVEGGARLGNNVTVKNGVLIFDLVTIEDDVFVGPGVVFTNDYRPRAARKKGRDELSPTLVRTGATLGAGAVVVCGITIGPHAFVAAGAVVIGDVPAHTLMVGNPARRIGWVCTCGERLHDDLSCGCGLRYVLTSPEQGLAPTP